MDLQKIVSNLKKGKKLSEFLDRKEMLELIRNHETIDISDVYLECEYWSLLSHSKVREAINTDPVIIKYEKHNTGKYKKINLHGDVTIKVDAEKIREFIDKKLINPDDYLSSITNNTRSYGSDLTVSDCDEDDYEYDILEESIKKEVLVRTSQVKVKTDTAKKIIQEKFLNLDSKPENDIEAQIERALLNVIDQMFSYVSIPVYDIEMLTPSLTKEGIACLRSIMFHLNNKNGKLKSFIYSNSSCGIHINIEKTKEHIENFSKILTVYYSVLGHLMNIVPDHRVTNYYSPMVLSSTRFINELVESIKKPKKITNIWSWSYNQYFETSSKSVGFYLNKTGFLEFRFLPSTRDVKDMLMWSKLLKLVVNYAMTITDQREKLLYKELQKSLRAHNDITTKTGLMKWAKNSKPIISLFDIVQDPLILDWYLNKMEFVKNEASIDTVQTQNTLGLFGNIPKKTIKEIITNFLTNNNKQNEQKHRDFNAQNQNARSMNNGQNIRISIHRSQR